MTVNDLTNLRVSDALADLKLAREELRNTLNECRLAKKLLAQKLEEMRLFHMEALEYVHKQAFPK